VVLLAAIGLSLVVNLGMMEKDGLCVLLGHLTAIFSWVFIALTSLFAVGGFQGLMVFCLTKIDFITASTSPSPASASQPLSGPYLWSPEPSSPLLQIDHHEIL
jgi:hypothetical protein